jgi:hypothetical protein
VRAFLLGGELFAKGDEVANSTPVGMMVENRSFSGEATTALLHDPNIPA